MGGAAMFDHEKKTLEEALGISDKRFKELSRILSEIIKKHERISEMIEEIMINDNLSLPEKMYLAWKLGHVVAIADLMCR